MVESNSENQGLMGNFHSFLSLCVKSTWAIDHLVTKNSLPGLQGKEIGGKGPKEVLKEEQIETSHRLVFHFLPQK